MHTKERDEFEIARQVVIVVSWVFALTLTAFVRYDFGKRHFTVPMALFGGFLMYFLTFMFPAGPFYWLVFYAYIVLSIVHFVRIQQRWNAGDVWHSRGVGISHVERFAPRIREIFIGGWKPFARLDDWALLRWWEPLPLLVVGVLLVRLRADLAFAVWLTLASVSLFFHNQLIYARQLAQYLDATDSIIESNVMNGTLSGDTKRQTGGFSPVSYPVSIDRNRDHVPDVLEPSASTLSGGLAVPPPQLDFSDVLTETFSPQAQPVQANASSQVNSEG